MFKNKFNVNLHNAIPTYDVQNCTETCMQKERLICKVCYINEIAVTLLPCGHLAVCAQCVPKLARCAVCQYVINGTLRTFIP